MHKTLSVKNQRFLPALPGGEPRRGEKIEKTAGPKAGGNVMFNYSRVEKCLMVRTI